MKSHQKEWVNDKGYNNNNNNNNNKNNNNNPVVNLEHTFDEIINVDTSTLSDQILNSSQLSIWLSPVNHIDINNDTVSNSNY